MTRLRKMRRRIRDRSWRLTVLLHRLDHGKSLKFTQGRRSFLCRASAEVAMSEAETEEALANPESAGVLLRKIVGRRRRGKEAAKGFQVSPFRFPKEPPPGVPLALLSQLPESP
jgi:hypothetical protein